jgi:DNA-binding transcriptional LysR family regulator
MLAAMASRMAITTTPASDAAIAEQALRGVVAIPLSDAAPAMLSLMWRDDSRNPLVGELTAFARALAEGSADTRPGTHRAGSKPRVL